MGCTIGAVYREDGDVFLFKNLDQIGHSTYHPPEIRQGKRFKYVHLSSCRDPNGIGVWAGVNAAGVAVLGADGNTITNFTGRGWSSLNDTLECYQSILETSGSLYEGLDLIIRFYQAHRVGGNGDLVIIADRNDAVVIEYATDRWGLMFRNGAPYLIRSNFFLALSGVRPAPEENSLYLSCALRYQTGMTHLSRTAGNTTLDDVMALLRNHDHGPSAMSICRHGGKGEYLTECSFIAHLGPKHIDSYTVINGYPCESSYRKLTLDYSAELI